MCDARIIAPIRFSEWVSNLVPSRKKIAKIRLCVDLRNLNKVSLKDNYPLPKMDHILQRVVGASRISLLDGFWGFNQILVHPDDQDKTTFTTPWGTFKYVKMPFELKNAGATFQRAMEIAFAKEIHDFLVIYLDDLTTFSKSDQQHLDHLRQVFFIYRKYGISLNPKKSLFGLEEGKLLSHTISKDGIRIDPNRIQAILQIPHPRNIKELQAFLGKINFLRRFIPNLAELIRLLNNMLKKDSKEMATPQISQAFLQSPWYADIIHVLQNLQAPLGLSRTKKRLLKMKVSKFCIVNDALFWKNHEGISLNFLTKDETDKVLKEFYAGDCGGHLYWKSTADKILRVGFYWPTLFANVKKFVTACHKFQIFEGKKKLLPRPLKPIPTEIPFQQWGLDFIGEIHPSSSGQHKWILTATDYFTKWIEAIPYREANDSFIIQFLETNILSRFGCPEKIITDNASTFKSKRMINFCHKYHITLGHSTAYYPQGNDLAESSNNSLINIIKKVLEENKKNWHKKLINALWADRLTTKRSIRTSPYELVYGM
eukprot:PITA_21856